MTLPIYFGTILIEPNRWRSREPSFAVSDWMPRIREAGFDGIEIWENHALQADEAELQRLVEAEPSVAIYGTYDRCEDETAEQRRRITRVIHRLGAEGMKYNLGGQSARRSEYVNNAAGWAASFGPEFRMLCECHGGTVAQEASEAVRAFEDMEAVLAGRDGARPRIEAILHMCVDIDSVKQRVETLGKRLTHVHVSKIRGTNAERGERLERRPEETAARLEVLREAGFSGTFTLEFTEGVVKRQSPDDIEMLFENAVADLHFLRQQLEDW